MKGQFLLRLLASAMLLSALGCGRDFRAVCEEQVDCADGNELDVEACIVEQESQQERADIFGCSEWYDLRQDCFEERADCNNGAYGLEGDDCEDENQDLASCFNE
ncbi:MAG: hypothetical protein AAGA56_29965 [Myxococcota bacterium]